jgi:putative oxidoreductase
MDVIFLVGRILFVLIFIISGATIHFSRQGIEYARAYNAPAPEILVPLSGAVAIAGGILVMLGIWGDLGALLIAGFLIGITPAMHAFWREEEEQQRQAQLFNFLKNVGLLGGALVIFYLYNQLQGEAGLSITDPILDRAD